MELSLAVLTEAPDMSESQGFQGLSIPSYHRPISRDILEAHIANGVKPQEMASVFGVSTRTIRRWMKQYGLRMCDLHTDIDDDQLDQVVLENHRMNPNAGYKMMSAYLKSKGIRVPINRVQQSLRRVDAEGTQARRMSMQTCRRRQYSVPGPNSLWHIDGNHKLIRWRIVVHGGVDGFSRLIVYLNAASNNRASTVLESFLGAVEEYGVPSRVRSDKGGENIEVATFMINHRGPNRSSHITGRSVHNQRIERMWRDVYGNVLDLFYSVFCTLEHNGALNPDSELDLYSLHWVFLPHVQRHLQSFKEAWNNHRLRTEHNRTPLELWQHTQHDRDAGPIQADDGTEVDRSGPIHHHPEGICVPAMQLPRPLLEEELQQLPNASNTPFSEALPLYHTVRDTLTNILA